VVEAGCEPGLACPEEDARPSTGPFRGGSIN